MAGVFKMESNDIFVRCSDMQSLWVYKLNALDSGLVEAKNWNLITILNSNDESYQHGLELFSTVISGDELRKLAEHLTISRLIVNREGLCLLDTAGITNSAYNVEFYRLNDLFNWSKYGVQNQLITTIWARCDIETGVPIIDYGKIFQEKDRKIETLQEKLAAAESELNSIREMLEAKEREWANKLQEKERELTNVRAQLEEARKEVERVNQENTALQQKIDGLEGYALGNFSGRGSVTRLDNADILIRTRAIYPSEKFYIPSSPIIPPMPIIPELGYPIQSMIPAVPKQFTPLNSTAHLQELPSLRPLQVSVIGVAGQFDTSNWWIITTNGPDFSNVSLAFYGGSLDYVEASGFPVPIPFDRNNLLSSNIFEVVMLRGIGLRFSFYPWRT